MRDAVELQGNIDSLVCALGEVEKDALSGSAGFTLVSVTSSEPDTGTGSVDTPLDIQGFVVGTASTTGQLRAERGGAGSGRVYTLTYKGMDVAGNSALCATTVSVPHSQ
jgi:large repetitive protein